MPCDTISTTDVKFSMENTNIAMLKTALETLGYAVQHKGETLSFTGSSPAGYVRGTFTNGQFSAEVRSSSWQTGEFDVNAVKRAYSIEVVKQTAKRFGWALKEQEAGRVYAAAKVFPVRLSTPICVISVNEYNIGGSKSILFTAIPHNVVDFWNPQRHKAVGTWSLSKKCFIGIVN